MSPSMIMSIVLVVAFGLFIANVSVTYIFVISCLIYFFLKFITNYLHNKYLNRLTKALPSTIDYLSRSLSSGSSIMTAIKQVAYANTPASLEFKPIYEALSVGKPFSTTLKNAAKKVQHADFSLCMAVLIIQQESGKHDASPLNYLSALLREKIKLQGKINSSSAESRFSGYLIAFLPVLACLILLVFNPAYLAPVFNTQGGRYLFLGAVISNIIGLMVMKKMTQITI